MKSRPITRFGYTLVELLIAITLSLFLLLGVSDLFRRFGSSINETQATLNMTANLNNVGLVLRSDLNAANLDALAYKPSKLAQDQEPGESTGYLEIIEGMNAPYEAIREENREENEGLHLPANRVFRDPTKPTTSSPEPDYYSDYTVGDVDDILAFTALGAAFPFRGIADGKEEPVESNDAEIIWFVRGTTLYRRVLLVNPPAVESSNLSASGGFYENNDLSVYEQSAGQYALCQPGDLAKRENRFAHKYSDFGNSDFPYPLYQDTDKAAWYFMRMPTLEETVNVAFNPGSKIPDLSSSSLECGGKSVGVDTVPTEGDSSGNPHETYWDLWENPNAWAGSGWSQDRDSGSISTYVDQNSRHKRAGEDIMLTNVLSFDVKVWNPYWVPCVPVTGSGTEWAPPQFVDLGQDRFWIMDPDGNYAEYKVDYSQDLTAGVAVPGTKGYGFTLKGRYNASTENRITQAGTTADKAERLNVGGSGGDNEHWNGPDMPCVFDSWSYDYIANPDNYVGPAAADDEPAVNGQPETWRCPPPYTEPLTGIQVTIRCFDPRSRNIKQIRIVRRFAE